MGLKPNGESYTLKGCVEHHHQSLRKAYEMVKNWAQHRREMDGAHYNKRAKAVPLLSGERVLVRHFRRRAGGKRNFRCLPEPFLVLKQLREGDPVNMRVRWRNLSASLLF